MSGIHLVVSCAKRKTRVPQPLMHLRAVQRSLPIEQRASAWIDLLRKHSKDLTRAHDLYSGDHWQTVLSIRNLSPCAEQHVQIWVCSAGYGLLPIETPITSYSATFTTGDMDSVCDGIELRKSLPSWWNAIAAYDGVHSGPRTIADLANQFRTDFILVALPRNYLIAVADDLITTTQTVHISERLAVLSVGGSVPNEVKRNFIPTGACLQGIVGGSLGSLNARLARSLIAQNRSEQMTLSGCQKHLADLLKSSPQVASITRKKITDDEVMITIRQHLKLDRTVSASRLLRQLRDSGQACEHSRFMSLYRQVTGGQNGRD